MIEAIFTVVYSVVSLATMAVIASEGIDENGNVYDDTAVSMGFVLGLIWPITVFAFLAEPVVIGLGKQFERGLKS